MYENYFDADDFCNMVEKEASKDWPYLQWYASKTGDGDISSISQYRTSLEMSVSILYSADINESLKDLRDFFVESILKPIDQCVWDYRNYYDLSLISDSGYALLKYLDGGEYHIHHDHGPENSRVLSLVACLGDEFEGGELEFPYFNVKLKLKKNSVVLFPSNFPYSHIAHPVTNGVK